MPANSPRELDDRPAPAPAAELTDELYRAYLAGDGPAVERIMALIAAAERQGSVVGA